MPEGWTIETVVEPVIEALPLYGLTTVTKRAGLPTTTVPGDGPCAGIVVSVVVPAFDAVRKIVDVTYNAC